MSNEAASDMDTWLQMHCSNAADSSLEALEACLYNVTAAMTVPMVAPQSTISSDVVPTFECLLLAVGIACNAFVMYIISRDGIMRSVTNLLLFSLSFADILFLFCLLMSAVSHIMKTWPFGLILCKLFYQFFVESHL